MYHTVNDTIEDEPETTFIERLIDEKEQLASKLEKLTAFFERDDATEIAGEEQVHLMHEQRGSMCEYLQILERRIDLLKAPETEDGYTEAIGQ